MCVGLLGRFERTGDLGAMDGIEADNAAGGGHFIHLAGWPSYKDRTPIKIFAL